MAPQPNILFLMTDQMQGQVLNPGHPCLTPNLDRLAAKGIRFTRAYTPNAICSPARASLMTGLLPHNHGVLTVTHTTDDDQSCLRTEYSHWAQHLQTAGYHTGYFGKWHVERSDQLEAFGWQVNGVRNNEVYKQKQKSLCGKKPRTPTYSLQLNSEEPPGYDQSIFYGVTDVLPEQRGVGVTTSLALDFLEEAIPNAKPWCCFVSITEPHDPFIAGQAAFDQYDVEAIKLCPNVFNALEGQPELYRVTAKIWQGMTEQQKKEAAACYYASITEIDQQYGRLIDTLEASGQLENTIVIFTSDHGELLGSHGLYCKNISAFEEVYHIPLIVSGPDVAKGAVTSARVGLHDLCPTLLELTGSKQIEVGDSRSFAAVLADPENYESHFQQGFAEYYGGRIHLTQRVVWDGDWKFVFNGFGMDELYNLEADPFELNNRAEDPTCDNQLRLMLAQMWHRIEATGDHSLLNSHYPPLRLARYGPNEVV